MPRRSQRDDLARPVHVPHDEDGVIRNVPDSRPYLPKDPERRQRLLWALRQARVNKEASHI